MNEMKSKLLMNEIQKIWKFQGVMTNSLPNDKKMKFTLLQLELKAKELNQPELLLINLYAYFYADIFKIRNFNLLQMKVNEFFLKCNLSDLPILSDEDMDLVYEVRKEWNSMHLVTMKDLPFKVRGLLNKYEIKIKENTFFKHTNSFLSFCLLACFVNTNRTKYPQIHGMKEFFIHLPIIQRQPKEYQISWYLKSENTLERYYTMLYGQSDKEQRLANYLKTVPVSEESALEFSKNTIWCSREVVSYIRGKLNAETKQS